MKTKHLLPIIPLTILTSITPILTSCNTKSQVIEIKLDQISSIQENFISSSLISITRNDEIHFSWNYSQIKDWSSQPSQFMFMFLSYLFVETPMYISMFFSSCSLSVNNEPLFLYASEDESNIPNKCFAPILFSGSQSFNGYMGIVFRYDNLKQTDNIELVYHNLRNQDEFYAITYTN